VLFSTAITGGSGIYNLFLNEGDPLYPKFLPQVTYRVLSHGTHASPNKSQLSEVNFFYNCWMDFRWKRIHVDVTARYSETLLF
jgi:hypothetical protein